MKRFMQLDVWRRSHQLVLSIYQLTRKFPKEERYGLVSQIRRSAASVPANIAEGSKRRTPLDFSRFLNIAEASLAETQYHLILGRDLGYINADQARMSLSETSAIGGMLYSLREKVENSSRSRAPRTGSR